MRRSDLIARLAELSVDLESTLDSATLAEQVTALCTTARLAFGAAAVSVAAVEDDTVRYLGAAGVGSEAIVGTAMPVSRGIAGYVAATGQALAIDRPAADPRFARDVAERTGFVPESLLVAPISGPDGDVVGVLSVLDRTSGDGDPLVLASAFALQAGFMLTTAEATGATARLVLGAVIDAARAGDVDLGSALARATQNASDEDAHVAVAARVLASLRRLGPERRQQLASVIADVVDLATAPSARSRR